MTILCVIEGCEKPMRRPVSGWCSQHYRKWYRHGDVNYIRPSQPTGPNSKHWRGSDVTYRTAHTRVTKMWGKATQYTCVKCHAPAGEWAYDGADPAEKTGYQDGYPLKYSAYPEFYMPMCITCHHVRDHGVDVCKYGHQKTDENVLLVTSRPGTRRCRKCCQRLQRQSYLNRKARALCSSST